VKLVLASSSPQRRAILEQLRIPFEVVAPDYVEDDRPEADPTELVGTHARGKALSVHVDGAIILGVDTAVVLDGAVYGKPVGVDGAVAMLRRLSGRTHTVLSGVCLVGPSFEAVGHERTDVTFRTIGASELDAYVRSGEWEGRAGGYAIQGLGARLVERIEGDYLNVVGLPAALLLDLLARHAPELLELPS
jgi:septum formation protein